MIEISIYLKFALPGTTQGLDWPSYIIAGVGWGRSRSEQCLSDNATVVWVKYRKERSNAFYYAQLLY